MAAVRAIPADRRANGKRVRFFLGRGTAAGPEKGPRSTIALVREVDYVLLFVRNSPLVFEVYIYQQGFFMSQVLGIKFTGYGQVYYFSSGPFVVRKSSHVLVQTEQGMGIGEVVDIRNDPPKSVPSDELKDIYRIANEEDIQIMRENQDQSRDAYRFCKKCVQDYKLDMKLVDVEVFFDRSKMIFYFTAPNRIDFRELVKDLVKEYRTRIELRQIGVRHESQMLGAIGNCGQLCCCRRFMRKFVPVTIKMAKEQNLFLNPTKISGICGRLLCCLSFEQDHYVDFRKKCPKIGRKYNTSLGQVKVIRSNFFKKSLSIITENNEEQEIDIEEWEKISSAPQADGAVFGLQSESKEKGSRSGKQDRAEKNREKKAPAPEAEAIYGDERFMQADWTDEDKKEEPSSSAPDKAQGDGPGQDKPRQARPKSKGRRRSGGFKGKKPRDRSKGKKTRPPRGSGKPQGRPDKKNAPQNDGAKRKPNPPKEK